MAGDLNRDQVSVGIKSPKPPLFVPIMDPPTLLGLYQ